MLAYKFNLQMYKLHYYNSLSHALKKTANQKPRKLLHILWHNNATGSISRKCPGIHHGLHIFPPKSLAACNTNFYLSQFR